MPVLSRRVRKLWLRALQRRSNLGHPMELAVIADTPRLTALAGLQAITSLFAAFAISTGGPPRTLWTRRALVWRNSKMRLSKATSLPVELVR